MNSNDFGVFWNFLADSNSNFVVAKIIFFEGFQFLVCSCECAVACLCPRNSISNVVVFVTIHDDIYVYIFTCKMCIYLWYMQQKDMKPLWKVENMYMCAYTYTYTYTHSYTYANTRACTCAFACARGRERGGEESGVGWVGGWVGWWVCVGACVCCVCCVVCLSGCVLCVVSFKIKMELNSFIRQSKWLEDSGTFCSRLVLNPWMGQNQGFLSVNLSKARDFSTWAISWFAALTKTPLPSPSFPPLSPVCPSQKPPCVDSKRLRVCRHHARMW